MIYINLCYEFFKIGLFAIGGGYTTLPFLYDLTLKYDWFTKADLTQMLAISTMTPGPTGINMATFAGYNSSGVLGSIVASLSIVLPSTILIILLSKILKKYKESEYFKQIVYVLRPVTLGLLMAVCIELFKTGIATPDYLKVLLILGILIVLIWKVSKDPILCIGISALLGIIFKLF